MLFWQLLDFSIFGLFAKDLAFWTKNRKNDFEIKLPQTVRIGVFRGEKAVSARFRAIGGLQHLQIGNFSKSSVLFKIAISAPLRFGSILWQLHILTRIDVFWQTELVYKISRLCDTHKCHFEEAKNHDFGFSVQVPTNWHFRCFAPLIAQLVYKTSSYRILTAQIEFRGPN